MIAYLAAAFAMVVLDYCWLTLMGGLYHHVLGPILADKPFLPAALAFYLLYLAGVVYFAVRPALESGGWHQALVPGAVLGLIAYGTYDLTNMATLKVWSWHITVLDMAWGTVLTAIAAGTGAAAALAFER